MAIGMEGKGIKSEDTGYLSDESDFYGTHISVHPRHIGARLTESGDEAMKQDYDARALAFDPADYWKRKTPSLTEIANQNLGNAKDQKAAPAVTLYNPYEGLFSARQLGETVDDFLERLPPATTLVTETIHWIYIANPYRRAPNRDDKDQKESDEAPPDEKSDWAQFVVLGENLLEELITIRHKIEKEKAGKPKATITRAVNPEKDKTVSATYIPVMSAH
jgi:hypothetical protein